MNRFRRSTYKSSIMFDQTEFTESVLHELEALRSLRWNNAGYRVEQSSCCPSKLFARKWNLVQLKYYSIKKALLPFSSQIV